MTDDIRPETAVRAAKQWLSKVYEDESIGQVALEEVRYRNGIWEITLGFERLDSSFRVTAIPSQNLADLYKPRNRVYKIVVVDSNDNHIMEMRDREVA